MKNGIIFLAVLAVVLGARISGAAIAPGPKEGGVEDREVLSAEYALAQGPSFYFVLNLAHRKLELKAKGMVMRSWELSDVKYWGKAEFPVMIELGRKSALKTPERFEIQPGGEELKTPETETVEYEIDALEVSDMPGGFTMHSKDGTRIHVKNSAGTLAAGLGSIFGFVNWHAVVPVVHLVRTILRKPSAAIELTFRDRHDSQSVYWVFFEGIKGIIY